ncbi:ADP-ribosylglycohydrolase family protein [Agrobacterium larrymoorei]|uniref:ADP-ribosylglycohydrolase family protein n=1 Tax=Agrobacterium larrymoorei TaxID=160699 RepID=A0A4D7DTM1_9HYPH|nr:ADP-ribosylglycohydrolase family protein [Agrobacterium larrymoorei]QCI97639.1 ADP-ribosylglycohydrolase family protein [Agrobacterium larrymoorei]QYA06914.1 ADP-ribosylglycohydrolase family protein [Agrobacterium larrymoorei]
MNLYDRIYGCLLGGACGDALGGPVEFLSKERIHAEYGADGITELHEYDGVVGAITDDTQMTLFTVEGLIRAGVRFDTKGICHIPSVVNHAYRRWLQTQEADFSTSANNDDIDGWLVSNERLWARRAPGATCLSALRTKMPFGDKAQNNSKGCGTVMRDAPFGFLSKSGTSYTFDLAAQTAATTHGHPSAQYASGALASIINFIADGHTLIDAVKNTMPLLERDGAEEVKSSIKNALKLSKMTNWQLRLPELGEGWVAEEALGISVLCALAGKTPYEAIVAAVNHSGDSDSTGAITGNIVGALHGASNLPEIWATKVELRDVIQTLAEDFTAVLSGKVDILASRYPGW